MKRKMPLKEYSLLLGEICHYTCDFFCLYHTDLIPSQNEFTHFVYELKLHFQMMRSIHPVILDPFCDRPNKYIALLISDLQEEYFSEPAEIKKDIRYALSASLLICKTIFSCSVNKEYLVPDINHVLPSEGGF